MSKTAASSSKFIESSQDDIGSMLEISACEEEEESRPPGLYEETETSESRSLDLLTCASSGSSPGKLNEEIETSEDSLKTGGNMGDGGGSGGGGGTEASREETETRKDGKTGEEDVEYAEETMPRMKSKR